MITLTETTHSSAFTEQRVVDPLDESLLSGMAKISNITLNEQTRSENSTSSNLSNSLPNHKRLSISSDVTSAPTSPRLTAKPVSKLNKSPTVVLNISPTLKKKLSGSSLNNSYEDDSYLSKSPPIEVSTRKTSLSYLFNSVQIPPSEKDFLEADNDDIVTDDENSLSSDPSFPHSITLTPFTNQVGGHTPFLRFSKRAVCKPLVQRERRFYEILETLHPDLLPFVPRYLGVLNVTRRSQTDEFEVIIGQNKHLLPKWMLNKTNKNGGDQKGCCDDQGLCTKVNNQLKNEVLGEVFSPKALRARKRQALERRHSLEKLNSNNMDIDEKNPKKSRTTSITSLSENLYKTHYDHDNNVSSNERLKNCELTSASKDLSVQTSMPPKKRRITDIETLDEVSETPTQTLTPPSTPDNKTNNSWSLHCYSTQRSKLQDSNNDLNNEIRQYVLLEDLTAGLKHPCVLDLKMGTRQYGIDATPEKRNSQKKKCEETTSKSLGVRICGMQVYKTNMRDLKFQDKYYGRKLKPDTFYNALEDFIHNGNKLLTHQIPVILRKLRKLAKIIRSLDNYRFYASSLLLIYDGDENNPHEIDIRIIDFAHCTTSKDYLSNECKYPPTSKGFDEGYLLGLKNLCRSFEAIYKENYGIMPDNVGEEENDSCLDDTLKSSERTLQNFEISD